MRTILDLHKAPIGVFDSGLGGLTVVRQIQEHLPRENILYIADQLHVPYGGRPLEEIKGFASDISRSLISSGCKAIVMACNISSAVSLKSIQTDFPHLPVIGVIHPGAEAASKSTKNGRIGVLATQGTVLSGAYTAAFASINDQFQVTEAACPKFVPLVENDQCGTQNALDAAEEYMAPLIQAGVDTVVLGCTHYPFLLSAIRAIAPEMNYIDPAVSAVKNLITLLESHHLRNDSSLESHCILSTTGDLCQYKAQVCRFMPSPYHYEEIVSTIIQDGTSSLIRLFAGIL